MFNALVIFRGRYTNFFNIRYFIENRPKIRREVHFNLTKDGEDDRF